MPLGSFNRATLAISDKLSSNCSAGELKEIEAFVKRQQGVDKLKRQIAALTLPEQIATAIEWLDEAGEAEAAEVADDILAASSALRRALVKRGLV